MDEDISYRQEKRLTKIYCQSSNNPSSEEQLNILNSLQERFSEPLPQPKNCIEATVLIWDKSSDAEKSERLRGQMIKIDELIKKEETQKTETVFERTAEDDPFGQPDNYFSIESQRMNFETSQKSYLEIIFEAEQRNMIKPFVLALTDENMQEAQILQMFYHMEPANALQEQIKKSWGEQGVRIDPMAQKIINETIASWSKQPPTSDYYKNVEEIKQSRGISMKLSTKLEARAYVFASSDDRERDKISFLLAAEATEKAAESKIKQAQEVKLNRELTQENPYFEGQTQTRTCGRSM